MRVVAQGIRFSYPRSVEPVLRDVSFDVPAGTSAAIIGPSGSGKTTLLSLIGRLLPMQDGTIEAVAEDGSRRPAFEVASWVLQTVSLLPDRSAADNVAVGAYSDGATPTEAAQRAHQYLSAVGLGDRGSDPARILSGGEAQRIAIARALASHRPVILADEPTGQLDARTSAVVLDAMIGSHGERTVVVVTHDPEIADRCDMVMELRNGAIVERRRSRAKAKTTAKTKTTAKPKPTAKTKATR